MEKKPRRIPYGTMNWAEIVRSMLSHYYDILLKDRLLLGYCALKSLRELHVSTVPLSWLYRQPRTLELERAARVAPTSNVAKNDFFNFATFANISLAKYAIIHLF